MKRSTFIKNAFILTATSLLLRTIGIFFRIYMSNKIGAEGMGLYQLIFSIYVLGSTFATSGISTAVTRLVADELVCGTPKSVRHVLHRSVGLSLLIGIASTALIFFGADMISTYWIKDVRAVPALQILSFSLPSMGVSSCLRGYFIARRKAGGPSRAQILEQAVRIGVVMLLIDRFAAMGLAYACMAVMIGDTVAEFASCGYMAIGYFLDKRKLKQGQFASKPDTPQKGVLRKILSISVPITAGRYLNSILRTIENILVPDCLGKYNSSKETGLSQFGALKGMAMPLIFFPSAFLNALSTLLIPEISSANALHQQGKVNRAVQHTLHLTLTASILISGVFLVFADQLGLLLYNSPEVGFYLKVLAPLTPIMYVESVVDGILKGLNQQVSSLKYSVADSAIRIVLIFFLVPVRGMEGFLFIMVLSNILTSFLNIHRLLQVTGVKLKWGQWILKPLLAVATAGALTSLLGRVMPSQIPLLIGTIIGAGCLCLVYCGLLPLLGCIKKEDLHRVKG